MDRLQRRDLQPSRPARATRRPRAPLQPLIAIPKPSSTSSKNMARIASSTCAACSPLPSGTAIRKPSSSPVTAGHKAAVLPTDAGALLFGSEIKALLAQAGFVPDSIARRCRSIWRLDICRAKRLLSGNPQAAARTHDDDRSRGQARDPAILGSGCLKPHESRDENYYVQSYRELLEGAVQSHLMSDVPLGVFLSGGVDSSAVAALMTKLRREPVETFSVGYTEQTYSELPFARAVSDHIHSRHHEVLVSEEDFFGRLPHLIWHEDEPIVWPSSVSLYFVARLARERVTVVLTGEGADETLAGYTRYAFTLKNAAMDRAYRSVVPGFLRRGLRNTRCDLFPARRNAAPQTRTYFSCQRWEFVAFFLLR